MFQSERFFRETWPRVPPAPCGVGRHAGALARQDILVPAVWK